MARMEDGSLVLDRRLEGVPTGATLGSLEGDVLVLAGSEDTLDGARWDVVGLNAETGESLWRTSFVGILTSAQLTLSDVVAPVIHTTSRSYDGDDSVIGRETQELRLLDKRTGEYVGSPIVWHGTEVANGLTGKMALWQGRLAAQAPKGFAVFETRPHRAGSDRVD
jgi:outer membrane protein assembly factor BamB